MSVVTAVARIKWRSGIMQAPTDAELALQRKYELLRKKKVFYQKAPMHLAC